METSLSTLLCPAGLQGILVACHYLSRLPASARNDPSYPIEWLAELLRNSQEIMDWPVAMSPVITSVAAAIINM